MLLADKVNAFILYDMRARSLRMRAIIVVKVSKDDAGSLPLSWTGPVSFDMRLGGCPWLLPLLPPMESAEKYRHTQSTMAEWSTGPCVVLFPSHQGWQPRNEGICLSGGQRMTL